MTAIAALEADLVSCLGYVRLSPGIKRWGEADLPP
jgi:hypothetical protein